MGFESILELAAAFDGPLTKYAEEDRAAEIDRRLEALANYCECKQVVMTKSHVRCVLGVDDNTLHRWANGKTQNKRPGIERRKESGNLWHKGCYKKKWLDLGESMAAEITSQSKTSGPMFLMKAVFGYREYEDKKDQVNVNISIEQFLKGKK